jgi:ribulose bisphosphate carboxylase small subunit
MREKLDFGPQTASTSFLVGRELRVPLFHPKTLTMENSRESTRNTVQELMNEVIEQGFHELISRPQESTRLNILIQSASNKLGELLHRIDHPEFTDGSKEQQAHWQTITTMAQSESLAMLSEVQHIRLEHNPRLKRT